MSDLSWLNPTPHAIAVYASRPLSPVATQHSLPSGRYSLLGPDFHRLDRTSFAWRTHSAPHARRKRTPDRNRTAALAATENDLAIGRLRLRSEYTRTSTGRCLDKASAPLKVTGWPLAVDGWRFVLK